MCGIIGVIGPKQAAFDVYRGLIGLQHRGQDAAGILSYDSQSMAFSLKKKKGLVAEVFPDAESLLELRGECALGHSRYSTVGTGHESELQPMATSYPLGVAMVHNGNVVNYFELVEKLRQEHLIHVLTQNDVEVIHMILTQQLNQCLEREGRRDGHTTYQDSFRPEYLREAVHQVLKQVKGGYAVIGMVANFGLFAFRDPQGIRPLVLGKRPNEEGRPEYCFCSETGAMGALDFEYVRNIRPGELVYIDHRGEVISFQITQDKNRPCMFEWIYFAGAESALEDRDVYTVRRKLGKFLAQKMRRSLKSKGGQRSEGELADIVVPVPETGRVAAQSLAEELGIPYREVLIKNRYVHRSFILNSQTKREKAVGLKLIPIVKEIANRRVMLVDDSIVRGTTSKRIVQLLKDCGAKDVIYVSTCPPIRHPCFYGIDFPDQGELLANGRDEEQISTSIGAQQVVYLDLEDLIMALDLPERPCMACLTGDYPVGEENIQKFMRIRKEQRKEVEERQT